MPACTSSVRLLAVAALLMLAPAPAEACAVCGLSGTQDNAFAYVVMTWVLSGLPLAMIGGVAFWVYRRMAAHEAVTAAVRGPVGTPADAVPHPGASDLPKA